RRLDTRSWALPFAMMGFVGQQYLRTMPTAGNDLVLAGTLVGVGLALGTLCGFATHIRAGSDGYAYARVGWVAGFLLLFGITARLAFAFAVTHGLEPVVRDFSIANHIGPAAWLVAVVSRALAEFSARLIVVQLRGRLIKAGSSSAAA